MANYADYFFFDVFKMLMATFRIINISKFYKVVLIVARLIEAEIMKLWSRFSTTLLRNSEPKYSQHFEYSHHSAFRKKTALKKNMSY